MKWLLFWSLSHGAGCVTPYRCFALGTFSPYFLSCCYCDSIEVLWDFISIPRIREKPMQVLTQPLTSLPKNVSNSSRMKAILSLVWNFWEGRRIPSSSEEESHQSKINPLWKRLKRMNWDDPTVLSSIQNVLPFRRREEMCSFLNSLRLTLQEVKILGHVRQQFEDRMENVQWGLGKRRFPGGSLKKKKKLLFIWLQVSVASCWGSRAGSRAHGLNSYGLRA